MDPMQNQLCRVCDEPAAGFHFGAFTCEGCKSFFGRTCNNQSVIGECKNNYRCVVDKKNRTSCKACRLRKCLMVGMSKSGSRYGRRSNWFKIHCLMQANGNKRGVSSPSLPPQPPPPPGLMSGSVKNSLQGPENQQLPPTLSWPPRLTVPPPLHSYANMLRQADTKVERKEEDVVDVTDIISVSRSPSPLNISSVSDTSSKSSQSFPEETRNNNNQPSSADLPKFPPSPLFPFAGLGGLNGLSGLTGPPHLPALSSLYNPLPFSSPLYRLR